MKNILDEIAVQRFNPNAFEEWEEYRERLTDIVIRGSAPGGTLAVYGAGRCNDIDLERLAGHFSGITLLDFDEEAMQDALRRYSLVGSKKVRTCCFDFVGISEKDYGRLADKIRRVLDSGQSAITGMRPVIETFYAAHDNIIYRAPRYDVVLAAGLHSQLNQTAVSLWRMLCAERGISTDPLRDPVCDLFHMHTYPIIVRFNQLLLYSARQKAFLAYEQGIEGRTGGVQGAMQLRDDLERRMRQNQLELVERHEAVWPQNKSNGMAFEMAIDEYIIL